MLFTIAIPTYNNKSTIADAIQSCKSQDYNEDYEILIVNNNSNDGTEEIISEYENSKTRIKNYKETVTMWENHNRCLREAQGAYVIFCHSDDLMLPQALTEFKHKLINRRFPSNYVCWGRSLFRDFYHNWKRGEGTLDTPLTGEFAYFPFCFGGLTPSGTLYSRNSLVKSGGFYTSENRLAPSDMSTPFKLALDGFIFEMSSFMIVKRLDANTAQNISDAIYRDALIEGFEGFLSHYGRNKLHEMFMRSYNRLSMHHGLNHFQRMCIMSKVLSAKKSIKLLIKLLFIGKLSMREFQKTLMGMR